MKAQFNNILCATDLSDFSNNAISFGVALAKEFRAKLFICHVVDIPTFSVPSAAYINISDYQNSLVTHASQEIEKLMESQDIEWEPIVTPGLTAETISGIAIQKKADLAISATHGRSGLKRFLLGSVTERLIRIISCPLLIVSPPEHLSDTLSLEKIRFKKIVVGCDFSPDSEMALNYGFSLAQEFESDLMLVHVIEPFGYKDNLLPDALISDVKENLQSRLTEKLDNLVPEEARNWCKIDVRCLSGEPYDELVRHAAEVDADLIILGVRGRGLMEKLLVGSTTDRVIRNLSCPVLSVSQCAPSA